MLHTAHKLLLDCIIIHCCIEINLFSALFIGGDPKPKGTIVFWKWFRKVDVQSYWLIYLIGDQVD